ncbi:MAG: hypothetical protein RML94_05435 [Bacteroidia bacterium]|nr:hypothetical protein [Bacteroidia bacterium]
MRFAALMQARSACCGLTVLRPTRPPPGYGVKGMGERGFAPC